VWDWFVSARAKEISFSGPMLQQKAKEVADKLGKKLYLTTGKSEQLFQ
jgi:hypothetical protein